jgi:hypothetical protein
MEYSKVHKSKTAAQGHIRNIKKEGGIAELKEANGKYLVVYSYPMKKIAGEKYYEVYFSKYAEEIKDFVAVVSGKDKDDAKRIFLSNADVTSKRLASKYINLKLSKKYNL